MIHTLLLDLDGTLADTAPDLAFALNTVLEEAGRAPLPEAAIRPVASNGSIALLELGFGLTPQDAGFEPLRQRLLAVYRDNIAVNTRLFPGMEAVLDTMEGDGRRWGVVTNKPAWLTDPLMAALGLARRAATIVSGDTLSERKPHPAPLLHACREAGGEPAETLYVGDAARDITAGRAAGMCTLAALYGYIDAEDDPGNWGADGTVDDPRQILEWITPDAASA